MHNRTCPICSTEVTGHALRSYCSARCSDRAKYASRQSRGVGYMPKPKTSKPCVECGDSFEGTERSKYCTPLCKSRFKERARVSSGYYQHPDVRARVNATKRREYRRAIDDGKASGAWLSRWAEHGKGEDATCTAPGCDRVMFSKLFCRAHYNAEFGYDFGNDYRRRAERWGVEFEEFSRAEIFDRDGWVCGICSEPIDRLLIHPDPMSVSLDHIIPMSKGGGHVPLNVTCAHLFCNLSKGNRHDESGVLAGSA